MKKSLLQSCIPLICVCPLLCNGCLSDKPNSPESDLNSPQSSYLLPENLPSTSKEEAPISQDASDTWDVSDLSLSEVDLARKLISFTFDDAPARTLESILAVFADFNERNPTCKASATLFINGRRIDQSTPILLSTAYTMGFELGNHSHSHYDLTALDEQTLREEIDKTDKLLSRIDGKKTHLFRAPFGKTNELIKSVVATPLIDWTIDTLDWTGIPAETIYRTVYDNRFDGAIVLMHDGYQNTVDALKQLLPALQVDGYQVVSVSLLAKAHNCTLKRGKTYIRARKQP